MSGPRSLHVPASVVNTLGLVLGGLAVVAVLVARVQLVTGADGPVPLDLALRLEPVASGLASPVLLTGAGDGSGVRYVVEQDGRIVAMAPEGSLRTDPLLDIRDRVYADGERGLLGAAFHPAFASNGRLFVAYTRPSDGATVLSEFRVARGLDAAVDREGLDEPAPTESTERTLLVIAQPYTRHKGGMLAFDGEGMLLLSTGDGGSGNDPMGHGQDRASLLGKLLRIDVDRGWPYAIPTGNGFEDDPQARPEVHAIGLRNPWRFSVDAPTGDVLIGDVGQSAWEEIDVLRPADREVSFGWGDMEGPECLREDRCDPDAHRDPAVAYPHVDADTGHCAVIGGYVYRGTAGSLPAGTYLYADHCSGTIWAVSSEELREGQAQPIAAGHVVPALGQVQSFGQDDSGELYVLTSGGHVLAVMDARTDP